MVLSLAGCAARPPPDPRDGPCAACEFTYQACLEDDDFGPCSQMRRFCYGWCAEADTCEQACEGANWGCEAAQTKRSTCDRIAGACPAWCEGGDAGGDSPADGPGQP
jgi:hypothetical protein